MLPYCISLGPQPVGVQCPLTSSLGEFPGYWDSLWYPGLTPVLVTIAFPFAFHISVFSRSLFACHRSSFVFLLYYRRICSSAPSRSTLHFLLMASFHAYEWLWCPMLWSQRRSMGCTRSRNLVSNF